MQVKRECKHPTCGNKCRRPPKPKPKRKPIKRFSAKRARENKKYSAERLKFLIDNPVCQFPGCGKESTDCHHAKGRGIYFLDTKTWKALCREHHVVAELNPKKAKQLGISESRLKVAL